MNSLSRVHLYHHTGPGTRGYVLADRQGLRDMAKKLMQAADGATGLETLTVYGSDGHAYELMVVSDITETEWQHLPLPTEAHADLAQIEIVKIYNELRQTLDQKNTQSV